MRVVQLLTQPSGGPADHVADVAVELARRGHHVHVVMPDGAAAERVDAAGVARTAGTMGGKGDLGGARALHDLLRDERPDVVHAQDRRAGLVGRVLARVLRLPVVYTLHGAPDGLADLVPGNLRAAPRRRRDRLYYLTAERRLAALGGRVVVASEALRSYAVDHVRVPAGRVDVVPNGVTFEPLPHTGGGGVAWVGLMVPVKRLDVLVAALRSLPGVEATFAGDGPSRPAAEGRIRMPGFVSDVRPVLAAADVLALPSAAENCPLVVLQAMAAGLPIVASRVGGVPELVADGETGLLVPPGDPVALAAALRSLLGDAGLRARMGAAGRARYEARYTVGHCVDGLLRSYERAAS
ncbi:MAG TPA: glycosyltransferase family 4 protein [Mycobacteriales bacterium]|nr:glycosyltransferase family 4 protein [Mycobacteriales bacterium]